MLVELEPDKRTTLGGIVLPDTSTNLIRVGRVLMAGPGRQYSDRLVPMVDNIIGTRVAFMAPASQSKQGKELRVRLEMDESHELIRLGDCLFAVEGEGQVDIRK